MNNRNEIIKLKLLIVKLIHYLLSIGLFYITWLFFRYGTLIPKLSVGFRYNFFVAVGYAVLLFWFNKTYNGYLLGYTRIRLLAFGQILSQFFSIVITYLVVSVAWNHFDAPWFFIPMLIVQLVLDVIWSYCANGYFFKINPRRKTLLIYRNRLDKKRFGSISGKPTERLYEITDEIQYDGAFDGIAEALDGYDAIFVAGINAKCRNGILKYCKEHSVPCMCLPHVGDIIMQEAIHLQSFDSPVLYVNRTVPNPEYAFVKRAFDMVMSGLGLIILSPIMLITGLAIHFYDGGPAFYRQTRLTKNGREFQIVKFRSMRVDAEKDGVARLSTGDKDDRITPIGRWTRAFRLARGIIGTTHSNHCGTTVCGFC